MIVSFTLDVGEIIICDNCGIILGEGDQVNTKLDWYFEYAVNKCCISCLVDD